MTIARKTRIPTGTLKPYLETLETTEDRRQKIAAKRRMAVSRQYQTDTPRTTLTEEEIADIYADRRYEDVRRGAPEANYAGCGLTEESLVTRCAGAGIVLGRGSRPGLWCVGRHRDITTRRMIKVVNSFLRKAGLPPLPDPDAVSAMPSPSRDVAALHRLGVF